MWRSSKSTWESATTTNNQQNNNNSPNSNSFSQWGSFVQVPASIYTSQKDSSSVSSQARFLGNDSTNIGQPSSSSSSSPFSSSSIGLGLGSFSASSSSFDFTAGNSASKREAGILLGERGRERERESNSIGGRTSRDENSSFFTDENDDNNSFIDSSSISDELIGGETFPYHRPVIPQSAEEASEVILDKLEQAGRVPSKEKFRRMACNVL
jgi:hypothetical protein